MTLTSVVALAAVCLVTAPLGAQAVPDTMPPVLLLHGFKSGAQTWDVLAPRLQWDGFARVFRTSTNFNQNIDVQKSHLVSFVDTVGIGSESPMLVAHSMGGLVARRLNTVVPADAVITIGSPHQGQNLLNNTFASPAFYGMVFGIAGSAIVVADNLFRCGQRRNDVDGPCYTLFDYLSFSAFLVATLQFVDVMFVGGGSTDDMTTGSGFLESLNDELHVAAENASTKIALVAQLYPWESQSSLFRMKYGEAESEALSYYLGWFAATIVVDGFEILADADSEDPWYWERITGGLAVVTAGLEIGNLPYSWNNLVGGFPNDGFMRVGTQAFPGATAIEVFGLAHPEETSSDFLHDRVLAVGAQYRRN